MSIIVLEAILSVKDLHRQFIEILGDCGNTEIFGRGCGDVDASNDQERLFVAEETADDLQLDFVRESFEVC